MRPVKVIVGLGNPGPEYERTRHNVGWWVLDRLRRKWRLSSFRRRGAALAAAGRVDDVDVLLAKPLTYVNRSGVAVAALCADPSIGVSRDLLVVSDDVALEVGRIRMRARGSAGGHNGLESIEDALGTRAYARLRVGVGVNPPEVDREDWVLSPLAPEDEDVVVGLLPELCAAIEVWLNEGVEKAMSRFNR